MLRLIVLLMCYLLLGNLIAQTKVKNGKIDFSTIKSGTSQKYQLEFEYDQKKLDIDIPINAKFFIEPVTAAEFATIKVTRISNNKAITSTPLVSGRLAFNITKNDLALSDPGITLFNIEYTPKGGTAIVHTLEIKAKKTKSITPKSKNGSTVTSEINSYIEKANEYIVKNKIKKDKKRNIYRKDNQVYIFLNEHGSILKADLPTTAIQDYIYNFIVISCKNCSHDAKLKLEVTGSYNPSYLNFANNITEQAEEGEPEAKDKQYEVIHYGSYGPFTDNFDVKVSEVKEDNETQVLFERTVTVANLYHVSISTGLFATGLRNPQNIEIANRIMDGVITGDSTLIADDPDVRGVLTVMAVYYPMGRSFLFPPSGKLFDTSRIGILVGAQLDDTFKENFFSGVSIDFARGGSFAIGAHFGRRNYIAGNQYEKFNFGIDRFVGELNVKKEWDVGLFFGLVIDTRVAGQLFKNLGN